MTLRCTAPVPLEKLAEDLGLVIRGDGMLYRNTQFVDKPLGDPIEIFVIPNGEDFTDLRVRAQDLPYTQVINS